MRLGRVAATVRRRAGFGQPVFASLVRSQTDAPSRFFLGGLEKKDGQRKITHSLCTGSCSEMSDWSEIRKCAAGFYKSLYRSEWSSNGDVQNSFFRVSLRSARTPKQGLEADMTLQELHAAALSLKNGRAPALDGLPVEFYIIGGGGPQPA